MYSPARSSASALGPRVGERPDRARGPKCGYRVAAATAARMASSLAGRPRSSEAGPYGLPHTGVSVACRLPPAAGQRSRVHHAVADGSDERGRRRLRRCVVSGDRGAYLRPVRDDCDRGACHPGHFRDRGQSVLQRCPCFTARRCRDEARHALAHPPSTMPGDVNGARHGRRPAAAHTRAAPPEPLDGDAPARRPPWSTSTTGVRRLSRARRYGSGPGKGSPRAWPARRFRPRPDTGSRPASSGGDGPRAARPSPPARPTSAATGAQTPTPRPS